MCAMHPSTGCTGCMPEQAVPRLCVCSPAELYGAMRWLDVPSVTADDVVDLIEAADKNRDGMLDYREYMSMLQVSRCSAPCPGHTHVHARRRAGFASENQNAQHCCSHLHVCTHPHTPAQHAHVRAMPLESSAWHPLPVGLWVAAAQSSARTPRPDGSGRRCRARCTQYSAALALCGADRRGAAVGGE